MPNVITISVVCLSVSAACLGRTITITPDGSGEYGTIKAAVSAAASGDVIVLADGVYNGQGNRDINYYGKAITIRSENGAETCIIDCEKLGRGFTFQTGENQMSVLDGITVVNGMATWAGGINCDSSPLIRNCRLIGNRAIGVYHEGEDGDAMRITASPRLVNCVFVDNFSDIHPNIFAPTGDPVFERCRFVNSGVKIGSNGYGGKWKGTFRYCVFDIRPQAEFFSWAIETYVGYYQSSGEIVVENSIFQCLGGVYLAEQAYAPGLKGVIRNNLFIASNPGAGSGIYYRTHKSLPQVTGNIITGFRAGLDFTYSSIFSQRMARISHNNVWHNTYNGWMDEIRNEIDLSGLQGHVSADPLFVDPAAGNYALSANSTCVDAGNPQFVAAAGETDFAGNRRVVDGNCDGTAVVDIGPYEYAPQNQAPVADAGADISAYAWIDGLAEVMLDASASYDPDQDTLHCRWLLDGFEIAAGLQVPVILEPGEYAIVLEVSDGLETSTDELIVYVIPAMQTHLVIAPPVINLASQVRAVVAMLRLPDYVDPGDIDPDYGLMLEPGSVPAKLWRALREKGQAGLLAMFDPDGIIDALGDGSVDVSVVCRLASGQYVYGTTRIRVINPPKGPKSPANKARVAPEQKPVGPRITK